MLPVRPTLNPGRTLELRFAARLRGHAAGGYFFAFNVLEYADAACAESSGVLAVTGAPPGEEWVELATPARISDGTRAVRFELNGSGEVGAAALFDELVIAPVGWSDRDGGETSQRLARVATRL